jgi:hypothetical protein
VKTTIKIAIAILVIAAAVIMVHHLPNLEVLMRKIHGG